jgi:hypothetical protein
VNTEKLKPSLPLWLPYTKPLPNRDAILLQPCAAGAFQCVTESNLRTGKRTFGGEDLIGRLRVIALLARPEMEMLDRKGDWAAGTGMTRRTIRRFPKRILTFADKIERLNHSGVFPVMMEAHRPDSDTDSRYKLFKALPDIVRAYAARIQGAIEEIGESGASVIVRDCREFHRQLAAKLIADVQQATGDCCYPELAELLSAAFAADGQGMTWGEAELKNLHERASQEWPPPRIVEYRLHKDSIELLIDP